MKNIKLLRNFNPRDSIWQFWGVIISAIAIFLSVVVAYDTSARSNDKLALEFTIEGKYLIVAPLNSGEELFLTYQGTRADNASVLYLTLSNIGSQPVRPEDYVKPISISLEPDSEIVEVQIISSDPSNIDLQPINIVGTSFQLSPSLLNSGDRIRFQVTLINDPAPANNCPEVNIDGRIAGLSRLQIRSECDEWGMFQYYWTSFTLREAMILGLIVWLILIFVLRYIKQRNPKYIESQLAEIHIANLVILIVAAIYWGDKIIENLLAGRSLSFWHFWLIPIVIGAGLFLVLLIYLWLLLRRCKPKTTRKDTEADL